LTGIAVSHSTQQRLVHRYAFEELPSNPEVEVEEMSIDGGKVRLRTAKGKALIWRDYKAVSFHQREHLTCAMSINAYSSQKLENLEPDHKEK
jgi:hypothetical protein